VHFNIKESTIFAGLAQYICITESLYLLLMSAYIIETASGEASKALHIIKPATGLKLAAFFKEET